jgi:hypothetical protein
MSFSSLRFGTSISPLTVVPSAVVPALQRCGVLIAHRAFPAITGDTVRAVAAKTR